jgi:hypothetical protein
MGQPTVPRSGFWRSFSFAGHGCGTLCAADWAAVVAVIGLVLTAES